MVSQFNRSQGATERHLRVSGLQGGHSGLDINRGRGNAVRILGRALEMLTDRLPLAVAEIQGGSKRNAIPREASATVVLDGAREQELRSLVATAEAQIRSELGAFDSGGSLGGLVDLGSAQRFPNLFRGALRSAARCSSDPLCADHHPEVHATINAAACHACILASETSCETFNRFLDRNVLVPTMARGTLAFFAKAAL